VAHACLMQNDCYILKVLFVGEAELSTNAPEKCFPFYPLLILDFLLHAGFMIAALWEKVLRCMI
jgi:hypothetical protein